MKRPDGRTAQRPPAKCITALGMHRSGTSAVSLSLRVFGARHGENLVGGLSSNPKGHWEDIDVLRLNERMLTSINASWDRVAQVTARDVQNLAENGFVEAAAALLRSKISATGFYALKDPRMTKLLPFWHRAFEAVPARPFVVFVFRNPASVAASLYKRDKLPLPHGYLLWASHMLECFCHARHFAHIFINYDAFIDNPGEGIAAIADCFRLPVDKAEFALLERDFLDKKLRHTKFDAGYLYTDAHCPPGVALAYERMLRIPPDGRPSVGDCLELTRILRVCLAKWK